MGGRFNQSIESATLPESLQSLTLGDEFDLNLDQAWAVVGHTWTHRRMQKHSISWSGGDIIINRASIELPLPKHTKTVNLPKAETWIATAHAILGFVQE